LAHALIIAIAKVDNDANYISYVQGSKAYEDIMFEGQVDSP